MPLGVDLEQFDYPASVHWFEANSQDHPVRMAFLETFWFDSTYRSLPASSRARSIGLTR